MLVYMKTGIKTIIENMDMSPQERQTLTEKWLESEYNIKNIKDPLFARSLALIHNHDDLPLHFGAVKIGTAFSALYVRLVTTPDGWHLATSRTPEGNETVKILHPKNEPASRNPENIIGLQDLIKLLKNGKVVDTGEHSNSLPLQTDEEIIELPVEKNTDEDILSENVTLNDSDKKTTSISIDMSKFMTGE